MRFYTTPHRYYGGIDLHARRMYICVLDAEGQIRVHRNGPATPEHFLATVAPYREDLVVAVECIFTWYWLADLCAQEGIAFVLGHALYMKAIHGGKAKNDKIDAHKIAVLVRGGMLPMAYVYPRPVGPEIDGGDGGAGHDASRSGPTRHDREGGRDVDPPEIRRRGSRPRVHERGGASTTQPAVCAAEHREVDR